MTVKYIPPHLRNNELVFHNYFAHLKDSLECLREIVEEDFINKPLDRDIRFACIQAKRSQELLECLRATCHKSLGAKDKAVMPCSMPSSDPCTSSSGMQKVDQPTNVPIIPSIGVISDIKASGSKPPGNTKQDKTSQAKNVHWKRVEDHPRNIKFELNKTNRVDSSISDKRTVINSNSATICRP